MIYTWGNKHRNDTFRTCIDALNRAKGCDIEFVEAKTSHDKLESIIKVESKDTHYYYVYFWWEDLAKAVGKAGQDIDFEKLTDKQYLKLCKYIVKDLWGVVKMLY